MRYLSKYIEKDLVDKMIILSGPRQVGKTTLALSFLGTKADETHPGYINWDLTDDKASLIKGKLPLHLPVIVLDEIHKYEGWRNLLKGIWDKNKSRIKIIVTGSARLDHYRHGGDSLFGRHFSYRLHPFSLNELPSAFTVDDLMSFGGFPEPLHKKDEVFLRRWRRERKYRVTHDDVRDLERVRDITKLEILLSLLEQKVGSALSVQSLRQDLSVSHGALDSWLDILDNLYLTFRVAPYNAKLARMITKEKKAYFWDWSECQEENAKFENLVACQLLKYCHFLEDTQGYKMQLCYLRDRDGREVDFVVVKDNRIEFGVECKLKSKELSKSLGYYQSRLSVPKMYQVHLGSEDWGDESDGGRNIPLSTFCKNLGIP